MTDFMPHGFCLQWSPALLGLLLLGNILIAASYFTIPMALLRLRRFHRDRVRVQGIVLYAAFIFSCGVSHLWSLWNIWHGGKWYYVEASWDILTGLISALAAYFTICKAAPALMQTFNAALETEKAQAEADAYAQKLTSFFLQTPFMVVMCDRDGVIVEASYEWYHRFCSGLTYACKERKLYEVVPDWPARWREANDYAVSDERRISMADEHLQLGGRLEHVEYTVAPWKVKDQVAGFIAFIQFKDHGTFSGPMITPKQPSQPRE